MVQCRERVSQLETVLNITPLLNSELNLNQLLSKIMKIAKKVMRAEIASLAILDEKHGDLVFQLAVSGKGSLIKSLGELQRMKLGSGINGTVAQTGQPVLVENYHDHPSAISQYEKRTGIPFGSFLCVPLKAEGKILGSCSVIRRKGKGLPFTAKDLSLFQMVCDNAALAILNAKTHQVLLDNQKLETDIEFSRSVQESFLPESVPTHKKYLFAGNTLPSKAVGGDFFDFIPLDKNHMGILLGDVSGKGFPAALHMARLMSDFRHVFQSKNEPEKVLMEINSILHERARRQPMFTTALFLSLDLKNDVVCAANAGHPPLIVSEKGMKLHETAPASGPPLGVLPKTAYQQTEFPLKPGDSVCLFSDGLLDAKNPRGRLFGLKRLKKILKTQDYNPKRLIAELMTRIAEFSQDTPQHDDVTVVSFKRR
ncbi:MAG: hypothetical protein NPINA01_04900 [Nitrospinaceae bacterium]|nr:MAG: hypothetical protein NPINA01_04900 [Nitrospinaceae bacterium]